MKTKLLLFLTLTMLLPLHLLAQGGWIFHSYSEGPVFDYSVIPGEPREYYDAGGPEKGMPGNLALTIVQFKVPSNKYHVTIVFEKMELGSFDHMKIYNGAITLDNYPNEEGEYQYHWPKNHTPLFETKGNPTKLPVVVSSTAEDGCLSVGFRCNSTEPGWKATVYCVKNGDPEPGVKPSNNTPTIVLKHNKKAGEYINIALEAKGDVTLTGVKEAYSPSQTRYTVSEATSNNPLGTIKIVGEVTAITSTHMGITSADISNNEKLEKLTLERNAITELNLGENPSLKELIVPDSKLTTVNLSKATKLEKLDIQSNQLTTLDLSKNENIKWIDCGKNRLSTFKLPHSAPLLILKCYSNKLNEIDINRFPSLIELNCSNNALTELRVENLVILNKLNCYGNPNIKSLNLSSNVRLTDLSASQCGLTQISFAENSSIKNLWLENNALTELDLSKLYYLEILSCYSNKITSIKPSPSIHLQTIFMWENAIRNTEMKAFIKALSSPNEPSSSLLVVVNKYAPRDKERNDCTRNEVTVAKNKGWRVMQRGESEEDALPYDGELTSSQLVKGNASICAIYNLKGEKQHTLTNGVNIIVLNDGTTKKLELAY